MPFLFGKRNPAAFAAAGAALFGLPALLLFWRRRRVAASLLLAARRRGRNRSLPGGAGLAAREPSVGPEQPARPVFWTEPGRGLRP